MVQPSDAVAAESLAEAHQRGQEALTSLLPRLLREAWSLVDLHDLSGTMPQFVAAVKAIVHRYGRASAAGALDYYQRERTAQGVPGKVALRMPERIADEAIIQAVREATSELYGPTTPDMQQAAIEKLEQSVQSMVYAQGHAAITDNATQDKEARGWYRVPNLGACSFCLLLATRGPVYKSEATGDFRAHVKKPNGSGGDCQCHAEPWFGGSFKFSPRVSGYAKAYSELAESGLRGKQLLKAFRAHVEDRPYIAPKAKKRARPAA